MKGLSARRVHIVAGMEPVPLRWSAATLDEMDDLLGWEGFRVSHLPIPDPLSRQSLERLIRRIAEEGSSSLVLLPSLGRARATARRVGCQSNLKQLNVAMTIDVQASRGDVMPGWITTTAAPPPVPRRAGGTSTRRGN